MNQRETLRINSNGQLEIGGVIASELAKKFGTPLYVFDVEHVEKMCKTFVDTLLLEYPNSTVSYASKAFCCKDIYRIISNFGLSADVVSSGELFTALSVNFDPKKICFHGNNKTRAELEYAIENKVGHIVIDSFDEINELEDICSEFNVTQSVLIRVNPGVEAHTHEFIQTAKTDSKFGFSINNGDSDLAMSNTLAKKHLKLDGLHCHIGSQIFEKASFSLAVEKMTDYYAKLKEKGVELDILDIGGGFGIYYSEPDPHLSYLDYADYVRAITDTLKDCINKKNIKPPRLIIEPGRSIVGEAGITLYTVGAVKDIKDVKKYLAIDGGMFENPRFALYQAKYSVVAPEKMNLSLSEKYSIAGKCCESGDLIAEDCYLPKMKKGDLIAVLSTGAYNYSMASNYNRNLIPAVIKVKNGASEYMVKGQKLEDLIKNDLWRFNA